MYCREEAVDYDRELLLKTIAILEDSLKRKTMILDSDRKSKVTVKLFENLSKSGVSAENVEMIEKETMELLELNERVLPLGPFWELGPEPVVLALRVPATNTKKH